MAMWTIVPVGKGILMITDETPLEEEVPRINEMINRLIKITGIPWVFIGNASLVSEEAVKEIAERFYGIKR